MSETHLESLRRELRRRTEDFEETFTGEPWVLIRNWMRTLSQYLEEQPSNETLAKLLREHMMHGEQAAAPRETITQAMEDEESAASSPPRTSQHSSAASPGPVEKPSPSPVVSHHYENGQYHLTVLTTASCRSTGFTPQEWVAIFNYFSTLEPTLRWLSPSTSTQEDGGRGVASRDSTEEGGPDYDYGREVAKHLGDQATHVGSDNDLGLATRPSVREK